MAVGSPLGMQLLHPPQLIGREVSRCGRDVRFELFKRPRTWHNAVHSWVGEHETERRLAERLPGPLEESELFDSLET
jgi:hypothetical protein